jgi:hypothetical protein
MSAKLSQALPEIIYRLESAIRDLSFASESAKQAGLERLHESIESAWAEADDALTLARQYVNESASSAKSADEKKGCGGR